MAYYVIHGYFDESGKEVQSDFIAYCGIVSQVEHWTSFCAAWEKCLRKHGLDFLHQSEIRTRWDVEERDKILLEFVAIIREYVSVAIGSALDVEHYKTLSSHVVKKLGRGHFLLFRTVTYMFISEVRKAVEHVRTVPLLNRDPEATGFIICDQDEESMIDYVKDFIRYRRFDEFGRKHISGISFSDAKILFPLQASDLIAYHIWAEMERRKHNPNAQCSPVYMAIVAPKPNESGSSSRWFKSHFLDGNTLNHLADGRCEDEISKFLLQPLSEAL